MTGSSHPINTHRPGLAQPIIFLQRRVRGTIAPVAANHSISSQKIARRIYDPNQRTVIARAHEVSDEATP